MEVSDRWWQKYHTHTGMTHVRRHPTDEKFICGMLIPKGSRRTNLKIGMCELCRRRYVRRHKE